MLSGLCAGAGGFNTADIIVLVILVLGVLAGIIAGFAKMLRGGLGTIVAIIVCVVCAIFLADKLAEVSFLATLTDTIEDKMAAKFDVCALPAKISGDAILLQNSNGEWVALTETISGLPGKLASIAQPVLVKLCSTYLDGTGSIALAVSTLTTKICAGAIIVIGGIIVLEILFGILSSLLGKLMAKQKAIRTVDRVIGLIFTAAISVLIVFAVMLVFAKLGDKAAAITDMIESSTVAKWFYENNPFVTLLS